MKFRSPARFPSASAFREHLRTVDETLDLVEEPAGASGPLGQPLTLPDGRVIGNRFAIHPMEGWDGTTDGAPSEKTLRRWRRFGESGAKLIWGGEAFAVQPDGRANPNQLCLNEGRNVREDLELLLRTLREGHRATGQGLEDLVIGLQLTHSGRFSRPEGAPRPRVAYRHPLLDRKYGLDKEVVPLSDEELVSLQESFVQAAVLAQDAGFDFVDIKCCHGYLLHEMLGAKSRPGPYGGSFENRTRFLREVVAKVRKACPGLGIGVRVSIVDTFPYHADPDSAVGKPMELSEGEDRAWGFGIHEEDPDRFDFREPELFLRLLVDMGIGIVNVTIGSPYWNPHLQRPAAYPPSDGYQPPRDPLYEVARHLRTVQRCKEIAPELVLIGTGYTYLQEYLAHVAEHEVGRGHVDVVGLGRMVLSYPDLPRDVLAKAPLQRKKLCRTFSDCTTAPRHGLVSGCYPLDDHYRDLPEAQQVKDIKRRARR